MVFVKSCAFRKPDTSILSVCVCLALQPQLVPLLGKLPDQQESIFQLLANLEQKVLCVINSLNYMHVLESSLHFACLIGNIDGLTVSEILFTSPSRGFVKRLTHKIRFYDILHFKFPRKCASTCISRDAVLDYSYSWLILLSFQFAHFHVLSVIVSLH